MIITHKRHGNGGSLEDKNPKVSIFGLLVLNVLLPRLCSFAVSFKLRLLFVSDLTLRGSAPSETPFFVVLSIPCRYLGYFAPSSLNPEIRTF